MGNNCVDELNFNSKENIVKEMAKGLKIIHSISIKDCPFNQKLNIKLRRAKYNVVNKLVDEDDFDKAFEEMKNAGAAIICSEDVDG